MDSDLKLLTQALRDFAQARDWERFHSPKNLASALSVEAAELLEHFQWLTEAQSRSLPADKRAEIGTEIAHATSFHPPGPDGRRRAGRGRHAGLRRR
jgi:NTP pyrophosphatase (non-canonical NTP hydrolase)